MFLRNSSMFSLSLFHTHTLTPSGQSVRNRQIALDNLSCSSCNLKKLPAISFKLDMPQGSLIQLLNAIFFYSWMRMEKSSEKILLIQFIFSVPIMKYIIYYYCSGQKIRSQIWQQQLMQRCVSVVTIIQIVLTVLKLTTFLLCPDNSSCRRG